MYNFDREDCKFIYLNKMHTALCQLCLLRSRQEPEPVSFDTQVDLLTYLSFVMEATVLKQSLI